MDKSLPDHHYTISYAVSQYTSEIVYCFLDYPLKGINSVALWEASTAAHAGVFIG